MKILSVDTSSDVCGVSILDNENLICNFDIATGRTHSENLMPLIQELFSKTGLQLKDIDLLVCDKGPGSFTGIRIGIATVMAFADSLNIPVVGINSLEALAYNLRKIAHDKSYICSIIDCKNDNCYFALYEKKDGILENLIEPQAENIEATLSILHTYFLDTLNINTDDIIFIGDGSKIYKDKINETFSNAKFADDLNSNNNNNNNDDDDNNNGDDLNKLNSYSLGVAGLIHYNLDLDVGNILPLYLKKPQAQRQLEEKQKESKKE